MKIANRNIGFNYEPLIVAEIGINHNGSLKEAFKLIDAAQKAGVEVIKHQTHIVEDEMSADAKKVYPGNSPDKSIYDIMKDCELSEGEEIELQKYDIYIILFNKSEVTLIPINFPLLVVNSLTDLADINGIFIISLPTRSKGIKCLANFGIFSFTKINKV